MIIGMNYDNAGERHIVLISHNTERNRNVEQQQAQMYKPTYDEVYILDTYMDDQLLTDYIVTKGCML